jgi:hypothetical protein
MSAIAVRIVVAAMKSSPQKCEDRDRLQDEYRGAVALWIKTGGSDPHRMSLPSAIAAKKDLDHIAQQLIDHRVNHGC